MLRKILYYLFRKPSNLGLAILIRITPIVPDKLYIKWLFRLSMGYKLDLDSPKTYNEKLQWLKVHYKNDEYTKMVDKVDAKDYVAAIIGKDHIIPTLGVYDNANEIDFDALQNQFVLKCTHDSGVIIICKDKTTLDKKTAIKRLNKNLRRKYYRWSKEWPYKDVKPRIIAEQYMVDESGYELKDYKFFCFNGEPKAMFIASDRSNANEETKFDFFDMEFNHLPMKNGHPNASIAPQMPEKFDEMRMLAGKLSNGLPQVRVDFYEVDGQVYFGELTFYHHAGIVDFTPHEWNVKFGEFVDLSLIKNK